MWTRCTNKNERCYKYYGGRGIKVHESWKSFEKFLADMGRRPNNFQLDRIDNNGDYEPKNCRWVDRKTNARNKSNNLIIEFNSQKKTASEWSEILNVKSATIRKRLKDGWTVEEALGFKKKERLSLKRRKFLTLNGETKSIQEWSKDLGIKRTTIFQRLYVYKWSVEKTLTREV